MSCGRNSTYFLTKWREKRREGRRGRQRRTRETELEEKRKEGRGSKRRNVVRELKGLGRWVRGWENVTGTKRERESESVLWM